MVPVPGALGLTTAALRERVLALPGWQIEFRAPEAILDPLAAVLGTVGATEPLPTLQIVISSDGRQAEGRVDDRTLWSLPLGPTGWLGPLAGQIAATAAALLRRLVYLHAGAVAMGGRAWIIAAASGTGKTSVVARLVRAGALYLADDIALLDPAAGTAVPFTLPLTIKPWTARAAGALPAGSEVARDDGTRYFLPAAYEHVPVPVEAFVLMRAGRRPSLTPLSRAEALLALAGQPSSLRDAERLEEAFAGFAALLRRTRCYVLTAATPGDAADLIAATAGLTTGTT